MSCKYSKYRNVLQIQHNQLQKYAANTHNVTKHRKALQVTQTTMEMYLCIYLLNSITMVHFHKGSCKSQLASLHNISVTVIV